MIPVYFPGAGRFQDAEGQPSGAVGAVAVVVININLRPQWLTAIRVQTVYDVPAALRTVDSLTWLARLDGEHTMSTDLTQSNIIVREAMVPTIVGPAAPQPGGVHWHPLAAPYPWSGGDNITLRFRRVTGYPTGDNAILPTVHVTLEGIMMVRDTPGTNRGA